MPTQSRLSVRRRRGRVAVGTAVSALAAAAVLVAFPAPASADTQTVTNAASMNIPAGGAAAPEYSPSSLYPSPVTVSGLAGVVTNVTVRLNGLSHNTARDVEVLLVGPGGQSTSVMSDVGSNNPVVNATLTFDDAAASSAPNTTIPPNTVATYKPTNLDNGFTLDTMPAPAPAPPYGSSFASFNGTNPNGTWNLYISDDSNGDAGSLSGGWTLSVTTGVASFPGQLQLGAVEFRGTEGGGNAVVTVNRVNGDDGAVSVNFATGSGSATSGVDYTPVSTTVSFADGQTSKDVDVPIADDPSVEGIDELVPITLSGPTGGATLGSPASGQLRIQDNDARANAFPIAIPATGSPNGVGAAGPYPSNVVVAGAGGVVTDVNVTVNNLSHTTPMDVGLLLRAPNGATTLLMSDAGSGNNPVTDIDLTFDDEAAGGLPLSGPITGGTYRPTDDDGDDDGTDVFPAPAPAAPWGTALSAVDGTSPNGTWSLYVIDDAGGDVGDIDAGWSLSLTTATASAGGPYTRPEGSSLTLSGSTDPDLPGATYDWDVDGDGQYDDATGANPTVSGATLSSIGLGDGPDSSNVRVRATSGSAVITSSATTLTVTNVAPTATFSNNGPVTLGNTADVTFSAQADPAQADTNAEFRYSYDFDDDGDWEVGDGTYAGSSTSASATVPTSVLDAVDTYEVNGRIVEKDGGFTDYTTTITVDPPPNADPVADAGPDQVVNPGDTVTLDGTGSTDADLDPLTYAWVQTNAPAVSLTSAATAQPTFTAPAGGSVLNFELTVDDGQGGSDTDTVTVAVNRPPVADAGSDQLVNGGDTVTLNGTGSSDPDTDTLTYSWDQTGGGDVTLTGPTTAQLSFTAPTGPTTLTFELTVGDGHGRTDTDTVVVTVNGGPVADAGPDQVVNDADTVTLDGTGSSDPDSDLVTFSWVQNTGPAVSMTGANTAQPSFTAPAGPASLTFELTVSDGRGGTDTDTVVVRVNGGPVADAGPDQVVNVGGTVTLDGTGSTDPDTDPLTYSWDQTGGTAVALSGPTTAQPTFTAPAAGSVLTFELTVDDGRGETDTDTVVVRVNRPPVAEAGNQQLVNTGDTVTLDGTGSGDPDLDPLTYSWTQSTGPTVTLTGANTAQPTFTAPTGPTTLTFLLTVSDGKGRSDTDTVVIDVNGAPSADAGPDQVVNAGDTVTLDGTGSTDPELHVLTYSWFQTIGPAVAMTGANTAQPTFTAPAGGNALTFVLTVDDGHGRTDTDAVTVTVNRPPVADAGPDQTVQSGAGVTLDGTGSTDPDADPLTYSWDQTGGPTVTLTAASTAQPTFTAPAAAATLTFELTVNDGHGKTDTDTVVITVNTAPTADAGPDQDVVASASVELDGTGSSDPGGDPLTYDWVQVAGPVVALTGADTAQPTFTAPASAATLTFELTVDDGKGGGDTDTVSVTVDATPPTVVLSTSAGDPVNGSVPLTIQWSEAVTGLALGDFDTTNATVTDLAGAGSAYTLTVVPTADGPFSVNLPAAAADDHAGNPSDASNSVSGTYDGTKPSVQLTAPAGPVEGPFTLTGTFSEPVDGLTSGDLSLAGCSASGLVVKASSFTVQLSPSGAGPCSASLPAGSVTDEAGNGNLASATLSRTLAAVPVLTVTRAHDCSSDARAAIGLHLDADVATSFSLASSNTALLPVSRLQLSWTGDATLQLELQPTSSSGVARVTITATSAVGTTQLTVRVVVGTDGGDRLRGSVLTDVILARGGADEAGGRAGRDLLCGGGGDDRLRGGTEDDMLHGEAGDDRLRGGAGADILKGGPGEDQLSGGPGQNELTPRQERRPSAV